MHSGSQFGIHDQFDHQETAHKVTICISILRTDFDENCQRVVDEIFYYCNYYKQKNKHRHQGIEDGGQQRL